jgi:23S rRNA (cytidine2498-2'-O)-methyltransferase
MTRTAYLAAPGYEALLARELGEVEAAHDRLLVAPGPPRPVSWAHNVWRDPREIAIDSISGGARKLRELQRNWALLPYRHHRRAKLIEAKLPHVSARPHRFPEPRPSAPLGSWTLLDQHTILAAPDCSSAFPHGEVRFVEDREAPPSRAYLKLWEAFTIFDERPGPGDVCVDLGSCPGGWTWVLQQLGGEVISVDKAPLDPAVAALERVAFRQESAFGLDPASLGRVDWMLCDVACYPARLFALVERWLASNACARFVCTLKFQGETDTDTIARFAAIPGSRLVHLAHNKHELTWFHGRGGREQPG